MENKNIKCPCCESDLVITKQERYQDLCEHVSDPNGTPSLKNGYSCTNPECVCSEINVTWIEDGEVFIGKNEKFNYSETRLLLKNAIKNEYDIDFALNSWNYHYELGRKLIENRKFTINLYWYKFEFQPKNRGGNDVETQYLPSLFKWEKRIWKRTEDGSYISMISHLRMIRYVLREFNRKYTTFKSKPTKGKFDELYKIINGLGWSNQPDERFYVKAASWIIRAFKKEKVMEIYNFKKLNDGNRM